jgi:hypothetical protein
MLTLPNPPTALAISTDLIKKNQVAFSWSPPVCNGLTPLTGYQILWDQGSGSWVVYDSGYLSTSLIVKGLNAGITYSF